MKRAILLLFVLVVVAGCGLLSTDDAALSGRWSGEIGSTEVWATITGDTNFVGQFTMVGFDQQVTTPIRTRGDSVLIVLPGGALGDIVLAGLYTDSLISGSFQVDTTRYPFFLRRLQPMSDSLKDQVVGWYTSETGDSLLFTYGPYGGLYFFDFNNLAAGTRYPLDDTTLVRLGDGGLADVILRTNVTPGGVTIHDQTNGTTWTRSADQPFSQSLVTFKNGNTGLTGLLLCPTSDGPNPGVVYIHGSGGNNTHIDFHDLYMVRYLAQHGVAVLIPDKRGSGMSQGDWRSASFDDLAGDAIAAIDGLKGCDNIDPSRIGVFGFSQGGWIAPLAASQSNDFHFVVNGSGAAVAVKDQIRHEMHNTYIRAGLTDELLERFDSLQLLAENYVATDSGWAEYDNLRHTLMQGAAGGLAAGFPDIPDHWRWPWIRRNGPFDPIPVYRNLNVPVLVLYGSDDETDNVPVRESIKRLKGIKNVTVKLYEGSGHGLGDPTGQGYVRTDALDDIVSFIQRQ